MRTMANSASGNREWKGVVKVEGGGSLSFDMGQGCSLGFRVGTDVLLQAGAEPALSEVEGSWVGWMR
jgi:hypothetical protein